ncbi:MAG TPA: LysE family transporter [Alphaproteobacteria bacterium]|nr:LysE family transporter [Alphaproteobacteria bacterium]
MLEEVGVFYRGLVLGVMVSAPVGPIGLLCIRRTIQRGLLVGFTTGLGAACADTMFGAVAAFGVAAILDFMRHYDLYIRVLGGIFLLFGAYHTWHDKPKPPQDITALAKKVVGKVVSHVKEDTLMGSLKAFLSGFAITITNPVTVFAVLAVVATFGTLDSKLDTGTLIAGIFFGACLWWIVLSGGIALVRGHFTEGRIIWINRITAVLLAALAVWAVISGVTGFLQNKTF